VRHRALRRALRDTFNRVPGGPQALSEAIGAALDVDPLNVNVTVDEPTEGAPVGGLRHRARVQIDVWDRI
jgi:hypothetical protein